MTAEPPFADPRPTLAIVGLGLMGGSLGLALTGKGWRRVGWDPSPETRRAALEHGAVDEAASSLAEALGEAEAVVLATPVRQILSLVPQVGRLSREQALVMDLGSTKTEIVEAMTGLNSRLRPVGGHPFCGKISSGIEEAEGALYRDAPFVLCPVPDAPADALEEAQAVAQAAGARPLVLDAREHDRLAALVSHVPYLAAVALMRATGREAWPLAASGFRDATRLAATPETIGLDILLTNRPAIARALQGLCSQLHGLEALLDDPAGLEKILATTRQERLELGESRGWN